ncbi:MAG: extracellular solute-binding protein [Candidatus Omnitrophica bacterium]|nr:extracellular solute-binding protein [Candidatus Omnitrophota bacterium]
MKYLLFLLFLLGISIGRADEKIVIISPHWEGVRIEVGSAFNNWHIKNYGEKVDIEWIDQGGTSDDLKFVESLFKKTPEGIGIDLFFGGGISPYLTLKEKGLLQPYKIPSDLLKKIPSHCAGIPNYDKEFYWYGIILSGFGILYNKKVLNYLSLPYPTTWESLTDKRYYGWVGNGDPRHSGSLHMMYEIILQAYGWEKGWEIILGIAGNTKTFTASASSVAKNTSLGEVAVSLCIDSYALAQIETSGAENMGFILPENLTVINPDAIGILKGAPNLKIAQRFINYLLSYEGQLLWILPKGTKGGPVKYSLNRFSIRPDVYQDPAIKDFFNPYKLKGTIKYDFDLASKRWNLLNDMIGALVIDQHSKVKKIWSIISKKDDALKKLFFKIPVNEKDQRFLWENWNNPVFRNQYINEWIGFSREKFRSIEQQIKRQ